MLRRNFGCARILLQKKQTAAGYMASAGKVGGDEKWAQAAMEYIYEKNHVNDGRKRQHDVDYERVMADAYDRLCRVNEEAFAARMERLITRMNESLEAIDRDDLREEALMMNSQQPPLNFRRPSLTPPVPGYEPAFGLDVPQLRAQQMEYPPVHRPTDEMEFQSDSASSESFPFVETHEIEDLTDKLMQQVEEQHGDIREAAPLTGVEGEAWEAYVALNKKALARQKLILDLSVDAELLEQYENDEVFRQQELARRGIVPLLVEEEEEKQATVSMLNGSDGASSWHFAQDPTYEPFRKA